ncbi:GNAT family N-acetyltransferase [Alteribacter populi]|uniref:GNAT family N-acetyltransferase n=1 Tax=Alteribacter populi TaxID=2011011 RepID=UPI0012FD6577|nr:GNAT family N-acetyltransferase [Alteribacter populi]
MAYFSPISSVAKDGEPLMIRSAGIKDAKEMLQLTKNVIKENDGLTLTESEFSMTTHDQAEKNYFVLHSPFHLLVICLRANKIVGIASFDPEQPIARMKHHGMLGLIVAKPYRSLGIGKQLMHAVINWARNHRDLEKLSLEVFTSNTPAVSLYESLGFTIVGHFHYHIKRSPYQYEDVYRMEYHVK